MFSLWTPAVHVPGHTLHFLLREEAWFAGHASAALSPCDAEWYRACEALVDWCYHDPLSARQLASQLEFAGAIGVSLRFITDHQLPQCLLQALDRGELVCVVQE